MSKQELRMLKMVNKLYREMLFRHLMEELNETNL